MGVTFAGEYRRASTALSLFHYLSGMLRRLFVRLTYGW
jgi:hypothetical protein